MRRWLWPYAILAALLSLIVVVALVFVLFEPGAERAGARLAAANAIMIEPVMRFLISMLEMIAPFELPGWFKAAYAILALVAALGLMLSATTGLLLLPVFYALYRGAHNAGAD